MYKSSPINSTHYAKLYPQNGEPVVAIDSVTSFHPIYRPTDADLTLLAVWSQPHRSEGRRLGRPIPVYRRVKYRVILGQVSAFEVQSAVRPPLICTRRHGRYLAK